MNIKIMGFILAGVILAGIIGSRILLPNTVDMNNDNNDVIEIKDDIITNGLTKIDETPAVINENNNDISKENIPVEEKAEIDRMQKIMSSVGMPEREEDYNKLSDREKTELTIKTGYVLMAGLDEYKDTPEDRERLEKQVNNEMEIQRLYESYVKEFHDANPGNTSEEDLFKYVDKKMTALGKERPELFTDERMDELLKKQGVNPEELKEIANGQTVNIDIKKED